MANKTKARRVISTNNKKSGKNSKQKKSASNSCDATKAAKAAVVEGVLSPDDDAVAFCQYLSTGGRLDARTLIKKLPATTKRMMMNANNFTSPNKDEDDKDAIQPKAFAACLGNLVYDVQFAAQSQHMTRDNVSDHIRMVVLHVAKGLGRLALAGSNNASKSHSNSSIDVNAPEAQDFLHDYAQRCYQMSQCSSATGAGGGPWRHIEFYQFAMDDTCEQHAPLLDRLLLSQNCGPNNNSKKLQTTTSLFLQTCPLYQQRSLLVYSSLAEQFFDETQQGKMMDSRAALQDQKHHLLLAAQGVTKGLADVKRTCWECGAVHVASIQCCTLCQVANYCGRDCQVKAWRSGHQEKCKALAMANTRFQESLHFIEAKHNHLHPSSSSSSKKGNGDFDSDTSNTRHMSNASCQSINPAASVDPAIMDPLLQCSEESDYAVLQAMVGSSQTLEVPLMQPQHHQYTATKDDDDDVLDNVPILVTELTSSTTSNIGWPSMSLFYQHLKQVQNGDMWIFPKNITLDLGAYADILIERGTCTVSIETDTFGGGMEQIKEAEYAYFLQLARLLCFDIVPLAERVSGEQESAHQYVANLGPIFQLADTHFGGVPMPIERFLELYHKRAPFPQDGVTKDAKADRLDQSRMRRLRKGYVTRAFMDAHHK